MMCKCGHTQGVHHYYQKKVSGCAIDDCECKQFKRNIRFPRKVEKRK